MFFMKTMSILMIILSIIMMSSSSNLIQLWISMEINMLAFIPLMYYDNKSTNSMLKYFLIQSMASSLFLMSSMLFIMFNEMFNMLIMISMLTKLGMFPMYQWFPQIASSLSWMNNFMLMSVQKIIPLNIMALLEQLNIMMLIIIMNLIVSISSMWNQTNLRKIMAFSSMNHLSWMILPMFYNNSIWIFYLFIYSIMILIMFSTFNYFSLMSLSNMSMTLNSFSPFIMIILLWSLGGMPPMMGFLAKFMVIMNSYMFLPLLSIFLTSSLISLFIYTKIMFPLMSMKIKNMNFISLKMNSLMILNMMSLFLIPMIMLI